jgi:plastocyanin
MRDARRLVGAIMLVAVLSVVLTACSGGAKANKASTPTKSPPASSATTGAASPADHKIVTITDTGFNPASVTVKVGARVIWTNGTMSVQGVAIQGGPQSPPIKPGGIVSHIFTTPGDYTYGSEAKPSVQGTVHVR